MTVILGDFMWSFDLAGLVRQGPSRFGEVRHVMVRQVRLVGFWLGGVWHGLARQARLGRLRYGEAR